MPKSASSFAFTLAKDIAQTKSDQMQLKSTLPEDLRDFFIVSGLGKTLTRISDLIPEEEIYVLKTHNPLDKETQELLLSGKIKAIVSYRDPYDIVVSLKEAGDRERQKPKNRQREYFTQITGYEEALEKIPNFLNNARSWMEFQETKLVKISFSDISKNPLIIAQNIAQHMGLEVDTSKIANSYVSNKESILEFNKGVEGRGYQELNIPENNSIKKQMDEFIDLYF
ncbi:MAG: sulfotransferase domain-containing protein [Cyanobacteriota bacterium]|nr:sulfotransferase domain-containing protein [Cyanobacteriota bacterium]